MPKTKKVSKKSVLLSPFIKPLKYKLTLKPDLETFVFSGNEEINIEILKNTKEITLHSKDIDIETTVIIQNKKTIPSVKTIYDQEKETVTFKFGQNLEKGKATLKISFYGLISESLRGFYRSRYQINGVDKYMATTQFEATDARRCFPCFDEPAQKATFCVSLIIPGSHSAISNTLPKTIREHEAGYKIIEFASTPRMSTYLLAFIIGEFEFVEGYTKKEIKQTLNKIKNNQTQVRVFTTPGKVHQAKFSLEVAIKCLEFYNEYFDIPYPLPVLDMIAIPDFESGAMENWGAVTYRETALLVDDEHTSIQNKQWVALVVAHELAHQWFGNLVTMHWWTDLWLNEGFASYIEYLAVDHIFPEWKIWDQFLNVDMAAAYRLDALKNSHPIEIEVHHPDEISEIFDMVSYAKGATVIRMLADYLGEENFRNGLRHYLKKHNYKNTKTIDLWESLEKISKKPVSKIMKNWTGKTGYPLISVERNKDKTILKQERFFISRISAKENKENTIWQVPVIYQQNEKIEKILLDKKKIILDQKIGKINTGEGVLLRAKYSPEILNELKEQILNKKMAVHDRLGIIRDLFALAEGGYIETKNVLDFSLAYQNESEYIVWVELASGINKIYNLIDEENFAEDYKKYALSLFKPLVEKVSFEKKGKENNLDILLRNIAIGNSAFYGDKKTIKRAVEIFKNRDKNKIDADIRGVIYNIVAHNGNQSSWDNFIKLYKKEEMHEEKDRLAHALTNFKDKSLVEKTLEFIISKEVRDQDAPHLIASLWNKSYSRNLTYKFIKKNWPIFLKKYGLGGHFLSRMLSPIASHKKSSKAKDIKNFFTKNKAPGAERMLEQGLEKIYSNEIWLKTSKNEIKSWLKNNYENS